MNGGNNSDANTQQGSASVLAIIVLALGLAIVGYFFYSLSGNHNELTQEFDTLSKKLKTTQRKLRSTQSSLEDQTEQVRYLNQQRARLTKIVNDTKRQGQNHSKGLEEAYQSTKKQLAEQASRADTLEQRLKKEQLALNQLKAKLATLNKQQSTSNPTGNTVEQFTDGTSVIRLENTVLFPLGNAALNPQGKATLDAIVDTLGAFPNHTIRVEGHTDHYPITSKLSRQYPSNWELSSARAAYAVRYLIEKGIAQDKLQAVGLASTRPLKHSRHRSQNRRIEIVLLPPQ